MTCVDFAPELIGTDAAPQAVRTDCPEALDALVAKVKDAQAAYSSFSQEDVDRIFKAVALATNKARLPLAKMAASETGMGLVEDKVIKNHFASEYIYNKFKSAKTCGIISEHKADGVKIIAEPLGVIAGVIPTTNPTSTVIFKALIALKTRNAIIFSPHPRARRCTVEAARIVLEAAVKAGAPQNIIGWIDEPSLPLTNALLQHRLVDVILATGGPGMVKAAYSSGKPALGVGAGNTPAVIDETADIPMAVASILLSKTFDNGMICASEQAMVVVDQVYEAVKAELQKRGAYLLNAEEKDLVGRCIIVNGRLNADIVGQPAARIAEMAGITVDPNAPVLVGEAELIDDSEPFAHEKLSPVIALYRADDFAAAVRKAAELVELAGAGHTSVLYTNERNTDRINYFGQSLNTGRIIINSPASHGGIGDLYNFRLEPSLTLGCGSWGGNSVSENVGVKHLLNYKTVAERRENMLWHQVPPKIYFKRGATGTALREFKGRQRALIVTDNYLFRSGQLEAVTSVLDEIGLHYQVFFDTKPDPDTATVMQALNLARSYQPDVIIAFGGGSPMDAAKIIWLLYEQPELCFEDIAMRFMDIRKRVCSIPELGRKAQLVAIPTTSGTGSEVTPFAVITDSASGVKYPIADYALTPHMAIIDANFVDSMPDGLCAASGIDALTHALESYVSVMASNFTDTQALEAGRLIFKYLPRSYKNGPADPEAREKVHYAATLAGMAFANAFLGVCHSMAHKLGAAFNLPHGIANALLINQVISFNATERPKKQSAFPQYKFPKATARYAEFAEAMGLGGGSAEEKVAALQTAITALKKELNIPLSIREAGVDEREFYAKLDELTELAFDDQCTGSNPVYPLMDDIRAIFVKAYEGEE